MGKAMKSAHSVKKPIHKYFLLTPHTTTRNQKNYRVQHSHVNVNDNILVILKYISRLKLLTILYNSIRSKLFLMKVLVIRYLKLQTLVWKIYKNSSNNLIMTLVVIVHQITNKTTTNKKNQMILPLALFENIC